MINYNDIGMKLTPQRIAILDCLDGDTTHPSAEDLYERVLEKLPAMSFATVYNTLEALRERGHVTELSIDPRKRRYDPDTRPHHHMLCVSCNAIRDVHSKFDLALPETEQGRFRILGSHVEFYGLCQDCDIKNMKKEVK
jgi:Fur family peroxide stress response transcriptional regulator